MGSSAGSSVSTVTSSSERNARVDDLALLVDLISAGWKGVDVRIARIEASLTRLEQGLHETRGAVVYRMEDRRPDAALLGL